MNRQRSAAKPDGADADRRATTLSALWETVPAGMRLTYISRDTVPAQYHSGLGQRRARPLGVDLSGLPGPLRKELVWCIWRIIEQGGKVDVTHTRMLARRIADTVVDLGSWAPQSLTELSTRDWQHQMALSVRRRTGALPGPATARDLREAAGSMPPAAHRGLRQSPVVAARGVGSQPWTRGFRNVSTSRAVGTASTSIASQPGGYAAARSGTASSAWKPVPGMGNSAAAG